MSAIRLQLLIVTAYSCFLAALAARTAANEIGSGGYGYRLKYIIPALGCELAAAAVCAWTLLAAGTTTGTVCVAKMLFCLSSAFAALYAMTRLRFRSAGAGRLLVLLAAAGVFAAPMVLPACFERALALGLDAAGGSLRLAVRGGLDLSLSAALLERALRPLGAFRALQACEAAVTALAVLMSSRLSRTGMLASLSALTPFIYDTDGSCMPPWATLMTAAFKAALFWRMTRMKEAG